MEEIFIAGNSIKPAFLESENADLKMLLLNGSVYAHLLVFIITTPLPPRDP